MAKVVVIYRSISGFTKKYAEWIANDLKADIYEAGQITIEKLDEYDVIIFGGSLHAVGINGIKIIKNNLPRLADKKLIIFAVGASPPRKNVLEEIKNKNFSSSQQKNIQFYYLRGGFDYSKLDFLNKLLMTLFKVRLKIKRNKTPDEKGILAAYSTPMDFTKKENITKLIKYVETVS